METMDSTTNAPQTKSNKKMYLIAGLLVLAIVVCGYLFVEYQTLKRNPNIVNQQKIEAVVAKASKLIDLPQGELPTLATVTDLEQLKGQPFFAHAEVGDEVLLYTSAQKAYLYSPSKNIIVEVASLNIGQ